MLLLEVGENALERRDPEARVLVGGELARARVEDRDGLGTPASLQAHVGDQQVVQSFDEPGVAAVMKPLPGVLEVARMPARNRVTVKGEGPAHEADQAFGGVELEREKPERLFLKG